MALVTRVLHVLPHPGGGGETYVDLLAGPGPFEHTRVFLSPSRSALRAGPEIALALGRLALARADIVHGHGDVSSLLCAGALRGRPFVISSHGLHMLRRVRGPARRVFLAALWRSVRASAATICETQAERDELAAVLPARLAGRLVLVPNGIALPEPARDTTLRAELGVGEHEVLGLFVGQLEPRKEPLLAIDAALRARAGGAPLVLALAGDGPLAGEVRARAGEGVRVLGFRTDLDRLLGDADIYLAPSRREGISYALLEAMGSGLVAIVADGPGSPEVVGDAGIVFAAGSLDAFAFGLTRLCADPELRRELGERGRRRVAEEFSLERFRRATEDVYRLAGPRTE